MLADATHLEKNVYVTKCLAKPLWATNLLTPPRAVRLLYEKLTLTVLADCATVVQGHEKGQPLSCA